MPALQVKDCPQSVYDQLKQCAVDEDRSLAQQTLHILKEFLATRCDGSPAGERAAVCAQRELLFAEIQELDPLPLLDGFSSTAEMVRSDREERDFRMGARWERTA